VIWSRIHHLLCGLRSATSIIDDAELATGAQKVGSHDSSAAGFVPANRSDPHRSRSNGEKDGA